MIARHPPIFLFLLALSALSVRAVELTFAGILGNSGGEGPTVIRSTVGRNGGGGAVDAQGRIFTGGGDRILVLSRRGNLLWETRLPKPGWVLGGPTFAIAGKYLYFVAGPPARYEGNYNYLWNPFTLVEPNLCRVATVPDSVPEVLAAPATFRWLGSWWGGEVTVTAAPGRTSAYVGFPPARVSNGSYSRDGYCVLEAKPDGTLTKVYESATGGGRVSVDESGSFYLGGGATVRKFDAAWQPVPGFAAKVLPSLGAVPTGYSGAVMLTKDAIWDMGHYGFVGRYTRDMRPNPGVLVQWEHALSWVAQIADAPDGEYYIKSDDALYVATVVDDRLVLRRRFGSLPRVSCLVLTPAGYVAVGCDARMLWFDFAAEACAAAPVKSEYAGPIAQGMADGEIGALALAVNPGYQPQEYVPTPKGIALVRYAAEPPKAGSNHPQTLATGEFDGRLDALTQVGTWYFALDGRNGRIVRSDAKEPCNFAPFALPLAGPPTAISVLARKCLLVAAGGAVHCFALAADGTPTQLWAWRGGAAPADTFGTELHLALFGHALLVADSRRHCVRLFEFGELFDQPPVPTALYGEPDRPGHDFAHVDTPTIVSLSDSRAVVYDSGNQRIVKLRLR